MMKSIIAIACIVAAILLIGTNNNSAFGGNDPTDPKPASDCTEDSVPAFPGAQGFGANTPGGRGGRVIAVTSLEAEGHGTLQAALRTKGPRIVVFRTGGTIELQGDIAVTEPFVTVA